MQKEGKKSATKTQRIASIAIQVKNQNTDIITKNKTWLVGWLVSAFLAVQQEGAHICISKIVGILFWGFFLKLLFFVKNYCREKKACFSHISYEKHTHFLLLMNAHLKKVSYWLCHLSYFAKAGFQLQLALKTKTKTNLLLSGSVP